LFFFFTLLTENIAAINYLLRFTGLNFSQPFQINRRFIFLFVYVIFFFFYFVSSILHIWPDLKKIMNLTMVLSIGVQISIRLVLYLSNPQLVYKIHVAMIEFCEKCDSLGLNRRRLLVTNLQKLQKCFRLIKLFHGFCLFFPCFWSLFKFVWKVKTDPPIFASFSFLIDDDSTLGYALHMIIQVALLVYHFIANSPTDCTYVLAINHVKSIVDIFECDLIELEEFLKSTPGKMVGSEIIVDKLMQKLIENHRECLRYFEMISQVLNKQFFVLITFNIYVICAGGITLLTSENSLAIGIAILYPTQVFFVCFFGSFVRSQHQRLNDIWLQFNWYQLPVYAQKNYSFVMMNIQQPLALSPVFIGVIDMELYTSVRKVNQF
jgi:7tm Odorant receptor